MTLVILFHQRRKQAQETSAVQLWGGGAAGTAGTMPGSARSHSLTVGRHKKQAMLHVYDERFWRPCASGSGTLLSPRPQRSSA